MKHLKEYMTSGLTEWLHTLECPVNRCLKLWEDWFHDKDDSLITEADIDEYWNKAWCDESHSTDAYISMLVEMNSSVDSNIFAGKVIDMFPRCIVGGAEIPSASDNKSIEMRVKRGYADRMRNSEELKKLCDAWNYVLTSSSKLKDYDMVIFEPTALKELDEKMFGRDYSFIMYHLTPKGNSEKILKLGLRPKKSRYREYPERIYLFGVKGNESLKTEAKKIAALKSKRLGDCDLIKVDLSEVRVPVHIDPMMPDKTHSFYALTYIPSKCLSKINIDDIDERD